MSQAKLPSLLALALALALPVSARADLVLIVHPAAEAGGMTQKDAVNIYMGRLRAFPSGQAAQPLDLPADLPEKRQFYRQLVGKELADIDAYWARLLFSGRTKPPRAVRDQDEMLELVSRNPQAIGYVARSKVDGRVKVVLELAR